MSGDRAIGPWAQGLTPTPRQRLGCFRSPTTQRWIVPSIDTWRRTLIAVDPDALSTAGATFLARVLPSTGPLARDGKARRHSASATEAPRLGVVRHRLGHWVAQADVGEKENEIPVAQRVLATLPLDDTLVTADALPTQTPTAPLIGDRGGESRLTVQANPPRLHPRLAHSLPGDVSPSGTEQGHGRIDTRTIPAWPVSPGIGFPYAQQAARLTRVTVRPHRTMDPHPHRRTVTEVPTRETVYLLTRRYPEEAGPAALWALARHPGSIEAMHHLEEVSFHADASTIRTGHGPAHITTLTRWAWPSSGPVTRFRRCRMPSATG